MNVPSRGFIKHALWLFFIFLLPASAVASKAQESQNAGQAEALWEQAIAAKGGREQLYRISSLVMSYQETVRNFLGLTMHRGIVERLYVFPGKSWEWDDGLPPPFRLIVRSINLERNLRCHVYGRASAPVCGPAKQANPPDEGIIQVQYLYLMETRWVKPVPLRVTEGRIGLKKVDVLHTRVDNRRVDYVLDRKTHLPVRVAVFYGSGDRATFAVDLSKYVTVSGIQMPSKQKKGRISFQINPLYDDGIFIHPPSVEGGPQAWLRSITSTQ